MLASCHLVKETQTPGSERTLTLTHRDPASRIDGDSQKRILTCTAAHTCIHTDMRAHTLTLTHRHAHTHTDTHTYAHTHAH